MISAFPHFIPIRFAAEFARTCEVLPSIFFSSPSDAIFPRCWPPLNACACCLFALILFSFLGIAVNWFSLCSRQKKIYQPCWWLKMFIDLFSGTETVLHFMRFFVCFFHLSWFFFHCNKVQSRIEWKWDRKFVLRSLLIAGIRMWSGIRVYE